MIEASRRLRIGVLLVAIAATLGTAVTFVGEPPFDPHLLREARTLRDGWFGQLMVGLSEVAYAAWLIPASMVIAMFMGVVLARWRDALVVAFATAGASAATRLLKETFDRARPEDGAQVLAAGFSMPSGHAGSSAAFATALVIVTRRGPIGMLVRVAAPIVAALVGLSRVVLGVHFPSDVVAGFCLGAGVTLLVAAAVGRIPSRTYVRRVD